MASIIDKINQIRQAVFGKDVRKAIADGIEAINAEVENNTAFINSKVEEVTEKANNAETQADYAKLQGDNAKIIYDNWKNTPVGNVDSKIGDLTQVSAANIVEAIKKDRSDLDNKASQADLGNKSNLPTTDKTSFEKAVIEIYNLLINKLSKSDVQSLIGFADINKNLSKIDQTMFTDELIAQIAGTAAVNAVSADGSIIFKKMAFPALVGLKSKNLFNKDTVTNGSYVSYSTGNLVGNATYSVSDYIPVSANTAYIKKTNQQIAFYDSNKVYISGLASPTSFTTPANTAFVRITVTNSTLNIEQLELGWMNPMSSIRSASSSTKTSMASSRTNPCCIRSSSRPGVATRMSIPPRNACTCGPWPTPPKITVWRRPVCRP
jgi:hypothetical protein